MAPRAREPVHEEVQKKCSFQPALSGSILKGNRRMEAGNQSLRTCKSFLVLMSHPYPPMTLLSSISYCSGSLARRGVGVGVRAIVDIGRSGLRHGAGTVLPGSGKRIRVSAFEIPDAAEGEYDAKREDAQGDGDKDSRVAVGHVLRTIRLRGCRRRSRRDLGRSGWEQRARTCGRHTSFACRDVHFER